MINLSGREPFAVGNNRVCYVHESLPGRCLKVLRLDVPPDSGKGAGREGGDDNEIECRVLARMRRWLGKRGRLIFPECYGFAETDLGRALVTELFTDRNGSISLTLDHIVSEGLWNAGIAAAVEDFKRTWIRAGVRSRQLRLHNLVVQEAGSGEYRIHVIDGLGHKGGVFPKPFHLLLRWKARKKIRALEQRLVWFEGLGPGERSDRIRPIVRNGGTAEHRSGIDDRGNERVMRGAE